MTAAELIRKLQEFPPDTSVVTWDEIYLDVVQVYREELHRDKYRSYSREPYEDTEPVLAAVLV